MAHIDWIIHYVFDQHGPGGICNIHTHGMEKYDHLDFQLVFPAVKDKACMLLNILGLEVQNGRRFEPGEYPADNEIFNCAFRLMKARETGRDVLRLILCDPAFRYPEDPLCEPVYRNQTVTGYFEE